MMNAVPAELRRVERERMNTPEYFHILVEFPVGRGSWDR
jgi:hypothetical protein